MSLILLLLVLTAAQIWSSLEKSFTLGTKHKIIVKCKSTQMSPLIIWLLFLSFLNQISCLSVARSRDNRSAGSIQSSAFVFVSYCDGVFKQSIGG
jgi:hypothetical protein